MQRFILKEMLSVCAARAGNKSTEIAVSQTTVFTKENQEIKTNKIRKIIEVLRLNNKN